jgi:hypothetical protein
MTRSHVVALLGGLAIGIGGGVVAIFLILNRVETVVPMKAPPTAAIAPAPEAQAATGAAARPAVHARLRKPTGATAPSGTQAPADKRRTEPSIQYPAYSGTAPIGSGGTIFSGADANDPRVQHFSD